VKLAPAITVLLLLAGALRVAAATVEVRLRPEVCLAAPHATLADLADLTGPADLVAAIRDLPVQSLSRVAVVVDERLVRAAVGTKAPLVVRGTSKARQPVRTISVADCIAAARAVLVPTGDDAEIALVRSSGPVVCGDDGTAPALIAEPLDRGRVGEVPVRVKVMRHEHELARALVVLRIQRFAQVVMLGVDLPRGGVIGAGDVALQRIQLTPATQDALRDLAQVVGRQANRELKAGQVLTPSLAVEPLAVRPGQAVTLWFKSGTIELSAPGEALAGGRPGEVVMVRRLADDRRIRGQVTGAGRVLVNF
jgi:flagella basal body P-ring formation protein FlgA